MNQKCTIKILDEVNINVYGLTKDVFNKVLKRLTYTVKGAFFMEKVRAKRWSGKISLIKKNGNSYLHLLDRILPIIIKEGYELILEDYRFKYDFNIPKIDNKLFEGYSHNRFKGIMEEHQYEAINAVTSKGGGLILLPTGAGKATVGAGLAKLYRPYGKILIVVPRQDLVLDFHDTIVDLGMECGVYYAEEKSPHRITITTWQSLELCPELYNDVVLVIIDEVQSAKATILFNSLVKPGKNVPVRIGMTATLPRDDLSQANIVAALGTVVYKKKSKELQDKGFLAQSSIYIMVYKDTYHIEYTEDKKNHQLYIDEITWQYSFDRRIKHLANFIEELSTLGNTVILLRNVEYGERLNDLIATSTFIYGKDKTAVRRQAYKDVNTGDNEILICTYGVAGTGIDIPRIFNLVLIEPGKESVGLLQSIGRGLRRADDKNEVNIFHISSDGKFSHKHLSEVMDVYDEAGLEYETVGVSY